MSSLSRGKTGMLPNLLARMSYWQTFVLMLVAGSLTVFSFAPFGLWPLQIFVMALLFSQLAQPQIKEVPRRAAWLAWAYSFSWLFACTSWLLIAMVRYGGLPIPLAVAALALLCAGLAAYAALSTAVGLWMQRHWQLSEATLLVVVFPGLWMLIAWLGADWFSMVDCRICLHKYRSGRFRASRGRLWTQFVVGSIVRHRRLVGYFCIQSDATDRCRNVDPIHRRSGCDVANRSVDASDWQTS